MNFSLKPNPLIALWVPGFFVITTLTLSHYGWESDKILCSLHDIGFAVILGAVVAAFLVGQLLDVIRDLLESLWDIRWEIKWQFFFEGETQKIQNLEEWFFTWYEFDCNVAIGIVIVLLLALLSLISIPLLPTCLLLVSLIFFFVDAVGMRKEIRGLLDPPIKLPPHHRAFTRIRPSRIHKGGVGVFAIQDINEGEPIFFGDDEKIRWVKKATLRELDPTLQKLYEDFCVHKIKNGEQYYGCPKNFNLMTIAWYLNHSDHPNVRCDNDYIFFALTHIKPGEELAVDYRTYNDW